MPKLSHTIKVKNPNTKVESEVVLEGLGLFSGSNDPHGFKLLQVKLFVDAIP